MNKQIKELYNSMCYLQRNDQCLYLLNYLKNNISELSVRELISINNQINYLIALISSERFLKND